MIISDIHSIVADEDVQQIYTLDGRPSQTSQKGVNIIRTNNGKTKQITGRFSDPHSHQSRPRQWERDFFCKGERVGRRKR